MYTEEVNKIVISNNDDKRLQTFDGVTTYPYGTNVYKVCESEMMTLKKNMYKWKMYILIAWINLTKINQDKGIL